MRQPTALAFIAAGAIISFAVGASPWFINMRIAGLVLMSTGTAGLWLGRGNAWLVSTVRGILGAASPGTLPDGHRVPLDELLGSEMFERHPEGIIGSSGPSVPGGGDHDAGSCHAADHDAGARA